MRERLCREPIGEPLVPRHGLWFALGMSIAPQAVSAHRLRLRPGDLTALTLTGIGLTLSAIMALLSDGVYHDDDLTHLQFARWA